MAAGRRAVTVGAATAVSVSAIVIVVGALASCGPREIHPGGGVAVVAPPVAPAPPPRPPMIAPVGPRLPAEVAPTGYRLTLEVDPAAPGFRGEVTIDVAIARPTAQLWLHGRDLAIDDARVEVDGVVTPAAVTVVADRELVGLDLGRPVAGPARLTLAYRGALVTDDVVGLFRQRVGDAWYLFSQFEAMHARRAVPCFDEPGWKAPWTVTLVVPAGQVAVGNAPEAARTTRPDGRDEVRFAPTPPMASYLLALAVGPFDIVDVGPVGRAAVPARVLVPAGRAADAAVVAAATPRVVAALEAYFDRALPLAKLDSVAVPSFPGAMENLGLITYGSELLLASPSQSPTALRRDYLAIAAHELAHQWFGNLVTLAWWDDLWLNEAFASWLAAKVIADLDPRRDVVTERRRSRMTAMARDRRPGAPAIRRAIATSAEAEAAFDPLAYDKGATVLAMFERAMGPARFRAAVRAFIAAHADGSATAADFAAALAVDEPAIADGLASFLDRPGAPRVELDLDCAAAPAAVARVTRALPVAPIEVAPAGWRFPLCVRFPDAARGGAIAERCGWLADGGGRIELGVTGCPTWLVGDAGGVGYYQVAYPAGLAGALRAHLDEVPVVDRGTLAAGVIAELAAGRTDVADALTWAERLLAAPDRHDAIAAVELLEAVDDQVGPEQRPRWRAWLRARVGARARAARLEPRAGETAAAGEARRTLIALVGLTAADPALVARGEAAARAWLDGGTALAGDDLGLALALAAAGRDGALLDRLRAALAASRDRPTRLLLVGALAAATAPPLIEGALTAAFTDRLDPLEVVELLGDLLASPPAQDRAWSALIQSPASLAARLPAAAWPALVVGAEHLCTAGQRAELAAFFAPAAADDDDLALALAETLEAVDDCVARRAHHAAGVAAALASVAP